MQFEKIKDSTFVRDPQSKALLNTDTKAILAHRQRIEAVRKTVAKDEKINNLEKEVADIRELLKIILEKVSKDNDK
jgi:hypothetical protein